MTDGLDVTKSHDWLYTEGLTWCFRRSKYNLTITYYYSDSIIKKNRFFFIIGRYKNNVYSYMNIETGLFIDIKVEKNGKSSYPLDASSSWFPLLQLFRLSRHLVFL